MNSGITYDVGDVVEVSDDTDEWWHAVIVSVNHLRDVYKVFSVLCAFSSHGTNIVRCDTLALANGWAPSKRV